MSDISKEDLKKEITAILKNADLKTTSAKKVRQQVEEKLSIDLSSRKKEIDEIVMQVLEDKKPKGKKNGKTDDDEDGEDEDEKEEEEEEEEDEEEEEEEEDKKKSKRAPPKKAGNKRKKSDSDESEEGSDAGKESDEEYSPNKKAKGAAKAKKPAKGRKKKGSDSDSDEDWGKGKKGAKKGGAKRRGTSGYNKTCTLTPELAAVVGSDQMARHEVVKKVWSIIKEKNLYDPKNKQFAICNDDLMKVIGVKRFRTFGMMKYLKKHFVD